MSSSPTPATAPPSLSSASLSPSEQRAYVDALLAHHAQQPTFGDRQAVGGVAPLTSDAASGDVFLLLGVSNRAGELCHFHGWIDAGETVLQGAAREGWEESRGVFAPLWQIYAALQGAEGGGRHSARPFGRHPMWMVNLGDTTAAQRRAVEQRLFEMPAYTRFMLECSEVVFLSLRALREKSLARISLAASAPLALRPERGGPDVPIRDFVGGWFASGADQWQAAWITTALSPVAATPPGSPPPRKFHGLTPAEIAPLSSLPSLSIEEVRRLAAGVGFATCETCGLVGHRTAHCGAAAAVRGTLREEEGGDLSEKRWSVEGFRVLGHVGERWAKDGLEVLYHVVDEGKARVVGPAILSRADYARPPKAIEQ